MQEILVDSLTIERLSTGQLKNSFANQRAHVSHVREIIESKPSS
jgi:hypothetical protein